MFKTMSFIQKNKKDYKGKHPKFLNENLKIVSCYKQNKQARIIFGPAESIYPPSTVSNFMLYGRGR